MQQAFCKILKIQIPAGMWFSKTHAKDTKPCLSAEVLNICLQARVLHKIHVGFGLYCSDKWKTQSNKLWKRHFFDCLLSFVTEKLISSYSHPQQLRGSRNVKMVMAVSDKTHTCCVPWQPGLLQDKNCEKQKKGYTTLFIYHLFFIFLCLSWKLSKWSSSIQILHAFYISLTL